ncbi:MAG: hypothetical protein HYX36_00565 [Rhizobiales bacterium]|nr:hypothetical protein [Hyphomicrobiales bacterium]
MHYARHRDMAEIAARWITREPDGTIDSAKADRVWTARTEQFSLDGANIAAGDGKLWWTTQSAPIILVQPHRSKNQALACESALQRQHVRANNSDIPQKTLP